MTTKTRCPAAAKKTAAVRARAKPAGTSAGAATAADAPSQCPAVSAPVEAAIVPARTEAPATTHERWVRQACKLTEAEYGALSRLKKRASTLGRPMKRGELLRAGLQLLAALDDASLFSALDHASIPRRASRRVTGASST